MNILLINPPQTFYPGSQWFCKYFPTGLASLAAVLEADGFSVAVLDTLMTGFERLERDDITQYGMAWQNIRRELEQRQPDILGMTSPFSAQIENAITLAALAKEVNPAIVTIIGGPAVSVRAAELLQQSSAIDMAVIGEGEMTLLEKLSFVLDNNFKRVSYTEAIDILKDSTPNKKKKFQYIINEWGADLQSEHERFLVEKHFKCPVILFDYPAKIKAFYMRLNDNTEPGKETVRAMDILFPGIGEIVGGSQREERYDVLVEKMKALGIDEEELWWYLDTRRFGSAVHSGFGLGFERLVLFVTGMSNIRDVIPFPRTPQNAEF